MYNIKDSIIFKVYFFVQQQNTPMHTQKKINIKHSY